MCQCYFLALKQYKSFITMHCKQNAELEKKYITKGTFMKQMISISKKFQEFEQQAYYSQLEQSSKSMIIALPADSELSKQLKDNHHVDYFIFIGAKQPHGYKSIEKTLINIIHLLPRPQKAYSIIYINTLAAKDSLDDFKKITQFLPIQYFLNLEKIYVLKASFMSKATSWISFDILKSFLNQKMTYLKSFKELVGSTNLNAKQLIKLLPQQIQIQLSKKESFVNQIFHETVEVNEHHKNQASDTKQEKIFYQTPKQNQLVFCSGPKQQTLLDLPKKMVKRHIEYYEVSQSGAPLPLELLIYYFKQRDNLLNTQGIFRKSVSIDQQNQLLAEIDYGNYDFIQTVTDPHLIANGIKRFLSYLLIPVVPYPEYQIIMNAKADKLSQVIVQTIKSLSELRKMAMLILLEFFMKQVIPKEYSNKMSVKNVSIVIGPCLMRSEVPSMKDLFYSQKIIQEFDAIFGNKKERFLALRKSAKDFNRESPTNEPTFQGAPIPACQQLTLQDLTFSKNEQKVDSSDHKFMKKMTFCLRWQLIKQSQKTEDDQFEYLEDDLTSNQLQKQIQQSIFEVRTSKISQQELQDI